MAELEAGQRIHTIPVPDGWSIEQAWQACKAANGGGPPIDAPGRVRWANVLTTQDDRLIRVLPTPGQLRDLARDLAAQAGVTDELTHAGREMAAALAAAASDHGHAVGVAEIRARLDAAWQTAVGDIVDSVDPRPAA